MNIQLNMYFATSNGERKTLRIDGYTEATKPGDDQIRAFMAKLPANDIFRHERHDFARPLGYEFITIKHSKR